MVEFSEAMFYTFGMRRFVILSNDGAKLKELAKGLCDQSAATVEWTDSLQSVLGAADADLPSCLIIDDPVCGHSSLAIARQIVLENALINLAVVSALSAEQFHEAAEGLGIMTHLPKPPEKKHAAIILSALEKMPVL